MVFFGGGGKKINWYSFNSTEDFGLLNDEQNQ